MVKVKSSTRFPVGAIAALALFIIAVSVGAWDKMGAGSGGTQCFFGAGLIILFLFGEYQTAVKISRSWWT